MLRRVRNLRVLRSRGASVAGEVTGYVSIWSKGSPYWKFSLLTFTTLDGRKTHDVPSVVTIADRGPRTPGPTAELPWTSPTTR